MGDKQRIETALNRARGIAARAELGTRSFCIPGGGCGCTRTITRLGATAAHRRALVRLHHQGGQRPPDHARRGPELRPVEDGGKSARVLFKDALELMGEAILAAR